MNDKDIVSEVRSLIAEKLGRERYELWFGATTQITLSGKTLLVETANKFFAGLAAAALPRGDRSGRLGGGNATVDVEFRVNSRLAEKPTEVEPADNRATRIPDTSRIALGKVLADSAVATVLSTPHSLHRIW